MFILIDRLPPEVASEAFWDRKMYAHVRCYHDCLHVSTDFSYRPIKALPCRHMNCYGEPREGQTSHLSARLLDVQRNADPFFLSVAENSSFYL